MCIRIRVRASVLIGTGLSACGHVIDTARHALRVLRASLRRVPGPPRWTLTARTRCVRPVNNP